MKCLAYIFALEIFSRLKCMDFSQVFILYIYVYIYISHIVDRWVKKYCIYILYKSVYAVRMPKYRWFLKMTQRHVFLDWGKNAQDFWREDIFQLAVPKIDFVCGKITKIVRPRGEFLLFWKGEFWYGKMKNFSSISAMWI